ncbi:class I SAM-dependent methyltransferase [Paraburkholderia rhynchosiae]|uniref:Ubiquinone biosynthesis O-methyltransferase, mitochondrial n=1 Tax=Paraburkholderia rhynchosiae TaxID=487049 RepID=A0A6J5BLJ9_9BURK|nr:class I SAM-dependent methyltransferase [Paraburkholderia rhynchosiae]CAB3709341.1 Ubiquinone biosynthesis O-methyltransferase, mitochondrial [Paraburkholderia rhynchosiae]
MFIANEIASTARLLKKVLEWPIHKFMPVAIKAVILSPRNTSISDKTWNHEYDSGAWDFLSTTKEVGRYSVILGYCLHFKPAARILDVGCGTGILAHWLSSAAISSYLGIDLSAAAIEKARQLNIQGAEFAVADVTAFKTSEVFDVIVFNEILYYLKTPEDHVRRFAQSLAPGGILIVSMWHHADGVNTWKRLRAGFEELDRVRLVHVPSGIKWNVAVLRPR